MLGGTALIFQRYASSLLDRLASQRAEMGDVDGDGFIDSTERRASSPTLRGQKGGAVAPIV